MPDSSNNDGLDIHGFSKIAKEIPPAVYEHTATVLLSTFQKLTSPITETTSGLGRYLRQKFDNMVDAEKAIAVYTIEKAITRAKEKAQLTRRALHSPESSKTFVKAVEEASKEMDPLLHEMWANLIASQLIEETCHPHFVEILPHFSPAEAKLLISLLPLDEVGEHGGGYLLGSGDSFEQWMAKSDGDLKPWSISCELLYQFRFADLIAPKGGKPKHAAILYRTTLGSAFLSVVTTTSTNAGFKEKFDNKNRTPGA